ncbi:glycosyl hydrolase catalytic core-domain-containing protein [Dichomitus squalens]|uniref:Glycosyl hydrolase catalytic core-domain-containing protein n=1 Tax=Dichomitus squalens TaxID=114155 RepID=A0A4Q9MVZ0_9APHY|nr:glycosyl hydrolase catalytic core-domain-containing protein [Dichomitus squalens]
MSKLLNLVALSSLAVLAVTFGPASTNALSTGHAHVNRHFEHGAIAKKKRDTSKRCKARPSTSSSSVKPTSTTKAAPTTTSAASQAPSTKPATKTTSSKSSSSTGQSGGSSGGAAHPASGKFGQTGSKICAAWGDGNDASISKFKTDHVVGIYTWGVDKPSQADALGYDFWPMLWGSSEDKIDAFEKAMQTPNLGTIVLGFNEPNEQGQSNMDPQNAASLWKQHIEPKRNQGYKLCSPAMSSRPNGQQWMADFMKACDGCHVDYQCLHWYDTSFDKLKTYLTDYHNQLGLPILLTEFADQNFNGGPQANSDSIFSFMNDALKFFDETDWILAACPFGIMHDLQGVNTLNLLQASDGSPTDLGYMVINDSWN